ncbi:MAG: GFA family protein [Planktomarina sp.]|jgi:hypothetical protein|nr:GFA family protein [Planktomarina sp.]MDT2078847.1 GFA family protein [Planktomarina sp.]|tara:strand:- start:1249 stop:1671 length:423 start_codon:yes stop_codon:yes gene_type:complete
MAVTGGCYCGEVRYEVDGPQEAAFQCHCRECQYLTGGNANIVVVFAESDFRYTKGLASSFARSDLENPVTRHFCGACGTGIGSRTPSRPNSMIVKVGTLDNPGEYQAQAAIFTCDRQAYHYIPNNIPSFDKRPTKKGATE